MPEPPYNSKYINPYLQRPPSFLPPNSTGLPISNYPFQNQGLNYQIGNTITPADQYAEQLNPTYSVPQYLPNDLTAPPINGLPIASPKQALHIPLQNYQNAGNNPYFSNPLMHNPPYSPYGEVTKEQMEQAAINNTEVPRSFTGGGNMYNFPAQNPQDQAAIQQLQNSLMSADTNNPSNQTGVVDANGNPLPNTTTDNTITNSTTNPEDKTFYDPNPITRNSNTTARTAFGLNLGVDALALMNNIVQPPPPTINIPLTHFSRMKYDNAQFDTANQQIKEDAVTSARRMREGISQAADLASSEGIINKNMAEAQRQVGMQERELQNTEMAQNNQLANQEQAGIDQARTQEMLTNWQNQSQAQTNKGNAITQNLQAIKQDVSNEAQYNIAQQANLQQQEIDKENIAKQQEIDMLGLEYLMSNDYANSSDYQKGVGENRTLQMGEAHSKVIEKMKGENLADLSSMSLKDIYDTDKFNQQASALSQELTSVNQSIQAQNEIINSADGTITEADKQNAKNKLAAEQERLNLAKQKAAEFERTQQAIMRYKQLLPEHYNQTKADQGYDEQYKKQNGIKTSKDYLTRLRKLTDRTR